MRAEVSLLWDVDEHAEILEDLLAEPGASDKAQFVPVVWGPWGSHSPHPAWAILQGSLEEAPGRGRLELEPCRLGSLTALSPEHHGGHISAYLLCTGSSPVGLEQWFLNWGPRACSISSIGELVRNAYSFPPRLCTLCFNPSPRWFGWMLKFKKPPELLLVPYQPSSQLSQSVGGAPLPGNSKTLGTKFPYCFTWRAMQILGPHSRPMGDDSEVKFENEGHSC